MKFICPICAATFEIGDTLTEFNSHNTKLLTVEETKAKIASLAYIQEELAKMEMTR